MALYNRLAATALACGLAMAPVAAAAQDFVNILTGGTSGVYYPLGVALSEIYTENMPDARVQVQATKASVENLNLLQAGRGELGFSLGDSVLLGWEGDEEAGFREKLDKLRIVAAIYPNYIQLVSTADSGVKTLTDLKGKTLSVGAPRSGTELNTRAILEGAGMSYDDLGKIEYLPFGESVELMKNRQLDATLQSAGVGVASIQDLASTNAINVVEIPADLVQKVGAPYQAGVIPAGTYNGQDADVETATVVNYLVTSADVPEETVYQMTKLIFDNKDHLVAAHQAAKDIDIAKAVTPDFPVPLHPGAERYYKEAGILK